MFYVIFTGNKRQCLLGAGDLERFGKRSVSNEKCLYTVFLETVITQFLLIFSLGKSTETFNLNRMR